MAEPEETLEKSSQLSMGRRIVQWAAAGLGLIALAMGAVVAGVFAGGGQRAFDAWTDQLIAALPFKEDAAPGASGPTSTVFNLPTLIVNRNGAAGGHLRVRLALVTGPDTVDAVVRSQPYLLDILNAYLPELTDTDLRGSAGLTRMRLDLRHRFNLILDRDAVSDVLIQELLIK
ncbi:MAG: flagellar basal body-associated FliL family protein [Alphaproteobacteria bacterium]